QKIVPFAVLVISLVVSSLVRWHNSSLHPQHFFGLSFTDITNTHSRFLGSNLRIPYINFDFEYPVVLGSFFYLMGLIGASNLKWFFFANSFFMSLAAIVSLYLLSKIHRLASNGEFTKRALIFWSLSPSIFLFTTYNWDHLAVLLMLWAIYLLLNRKEYLGFGVLALGAFTKMFPGFLLAPFLIYTAKNTNYKKVLGGGLVFTAVSLVINLPIMLYKFSAWTYFFKFSGERGAFGDNIWAFIFVLQNKFGWLSDFNFVKAVSVLSLAFFAVLYLIINYRYFKDKKNPFLQTCFLSMVAYLIIAKTTSAPFTLWLLPFLVILPVNIWAGLIYDWANAFVYYAFFQYIYYNDFLRMAVSPGHYFRWTCIGVWVREFGLLFAGVNYLKRLKWLSRKV
ncbi:MAG: glycosyltransferase 87 family protein, partial [bacterium]